MAGVLIIGPWTAALLAAAWLSRVSILIEYEEAPSKVEQAAEHWKLDRIATTDKSVLRLGTAELLYMAGTPARVVIDESVDIARKYGRKESGRFVNGVLDRVARDARPGELDAARRI